MKRQEIQIVIFFSWFLLHTISDLDAQNDQESKLDLEGLSRSEIRQEFLSLGETSEFYNMASESKKANGQSIRSLFLEDFSLQVEYTRWSKRAIDPREFLLLASDSP